jgi:Concanavalin A-like lectin/glucanases superfamily
LLLCLSLWPREPQAQTLTGAPVNLQAPTARGLIAWWRAVPGTTGGTRFYDLLGRDAITLVNTTARASTERPGGAGYASFDGATAYGLTAGAPARFFPTEQTMMAWIKRTAIGGSSQGILGAGTTIERQFGVASSGALQYVYHASDGGYPVGDFTGPALAVGTWYHVAMMNSLTGGFGAYVNCQVQQAFAPNGTTYLALTQKVLIGSSDTGALSNYDYFSGLIDDVRLYNRALPQGELCQIVQESRRGEPVLLRSPLVALGLAPSGPSGPPGSFLPFFSQP